MELSRTLCGLPRGFVRTVKAFSGIERSAENKLAQLEAATVNFRRS